MPTCPIHGEVSAIVEQEDGTVFCKQCFEDWITTGSSHLQEEGYKTAAAGRLTMGAIHEILTQYLMNFHDIEDDEEDELPEPSEGYGRVIPSFMWIEDDGELSLDYTLQEKMTDKEKEEKASAAN